MRRKKALYIGGLAVAVVGLGAWALLNGDSDITYRTAAVDRGEVDSTISATGNPNAVVTVQ